jgi:hypothetical protein
MIRLVARAVLEALAATAVSAGVGALLRRLVARP